MLKDIFEGYEKLIIETEEKEEVVEITEEEITVKAGYRVRLIPCKE
mgnify:CR=1 FL=1